MARQPRHGAKADLADAGPMAADVPAYVETRQEKTPRRGRRARATTVPATTAGSAPAVSGTGALTKAGRPGQEEATTAAIPTQEPVEGTDNGGLNRRQRRALARREQWYQAVEGTPAPSTTPAADRGADRGSAPASPGQDADRRRHRRRRDKRGEDNEPHPAQTSPDVAGQETAGDGVMVLPEPKGYVLRKVSRRARRGWYAPVAAPALTSTRQAEVLNTTLVAAPTDAHGIVVGRDRLSNTMVAHDPFTAYEQGVVDSPAVVVLGGIGNGKSSLLKTVYVLRPLILRSRRVVVMDRKDQNGEGEYAEVARQFGNEPLRMVLGEGGTTINMLDPVFLASAGIAGQFRLLRAVTELANDGEGLTKWERPALRAAHRATLRQAETDGATPRLEHLLDQLGRMHPEFADHSSAAKEKVHQGGVAVRHMLSALLSDELAGLFDGQTSPEVRLADRLTVFDVSQLPDEGPAVSMVMAVANVWLLGTLRRQRGLRTNFVAEEGWDLVGGPGGRVFKRNSKLARGLGLSNIAALHHVADIPVDDPAIAMLKEAGTAHLFKQERDDDVQAVIRTYGLDPSSAGVLANLATGHHLLKIGSRREIHVEHVRSTMEKVITNTDSAMMLDGRGRGL